MTAELRVLILLAPLWFPVAPAAEAAPAGDASERVRDGDPVNDLRRWLDRYRRGRTDLYEQVESGVRRPKDGGAPLRYFRTEAVDELQTLLDRAADHGGTNAARILVQAATYRAAKDPSIERQKYVSRQPWLVRRRATEALARIDDPAVHEWLRDSVLHDRSPTDGAAKRALAAITLARQGDAEAFPGIVALTTDEVPAVRTEAAEALGILGDPRGLEPLIHALADENPKVRLQALSSIDRLAAAHPDDAVLAAARLAQGRAALRDPDWSLRYSATLLLRDHPDEASVPALLSALQREAVDAEGARRRVRCALRRTLGALTGEDFPSYRPEDWNHWWEENRERFTCSDEQYPELPDEQGGRFFGIPVESDVVVFLLDASGSMSHPLPTDPGGPERLFLAVRELKRSLKALEDGTRFNIVLFNEAITPFRPEPIPVAEESRQAAFDFLSGVQPGGGTNLFGALEFALGLDPENPRSRGTAATGDELDTIIVLTDGTPSRGPILIPEEIVHQITRANRGRRIAIHTVAAGKSDQAFLAELAERNHGQTCVMAN